MLDNKSKPLNSNFKLSHNMVLNIIYNKSINNINLVIKNSFYNYLISFKYPKIKKDIESAQLQIENYNKQNNTSST